jgi:hypothetical protein
MGRSKKTHGKKIIKEYNKENVKKAKIKAYKLKKMKTISQNLEQFTSQIEEIDSGEDDGCSIGQEFTDDEHLDWNDAESIDSDEDDRFQTEVNDETIRIFNDFRPLYNGSLLSVKQFALTFLYICNQFKLSESHSNVLLKFLRYILPSNNRVPLSYYLIKRHFQSKTSNDFCKDCMKFECGCTSSKKTKIISFEYAIQLRKLVERQYSTIIEYKSKDFLIN